MSLEKALIDSLVQQSITHFFCVPALAIDSFCFEVVNCEKASLVVANNELSAAYMAEGYVRIHGKPAVVLSGAGIVATHTLPGYINAVTESIPVFYLFSTLEKSLRFQHLDSEEIYYKKLFSNDQSIFQQPSTLSEIENSLRNCYSYLSDNKPACLLLAPNLLSKEMEFTGKSLVDKVLPTTNHGDIECLSEVINRWGCSRRPLLVLGSRATVNHRSNLINQHVNRLNVDTLVTLGAKGYVTSDNPNFKGMVSFKPVVADNSRLINSDYDLVLIIGAEFNEREELSVNSFKKIKNRTVIRIDSKIHNQTAETFVDTEIFYSKPDLVLEKLIQKESCKDSNILEDSVTISPRLSSQIKLYESLIVELQKSISKDSIVFVDAGLHRIASARAWQVFSPGSFQNCAKQAPLGWSLPAAIGASFADNAPPLIVVAGDGGMRMLGNEIATASKYKKSMLILVCNNAAYQSVGQRVDDQKLNMQISSLPRIDWVEFGKTLGADGQTISDVDQLDSAISLARNFHGPFIINFNC